MMIATATAPKNKEKMVTAYGVSLPATKDFQIKFGNPLLRELWFFRHIDSFTANGAGRTYDGPGKYQHAVNAANMLWRQPGKELFKWHPDLETALKTYCEVKAKGETLVTGPASGGKTFGAAIYAYLSFLCDPDNTGVLVCSSTLDGLKKRLWGEIRKLHLANAHEPLMGCLNIVDSLTCIQASKGETKRGIFGIAVAEGNETKAIGRIIGFHPPRLIVIVDELTDVGWAIVEACTNLFTGKQKAHFIGIGNASSIFDSHGKMCEPAEDWNSITVESERWATKRGGVCIHFDGFKSPNVVAGRVIFEFLLTTEDIANTAKNYGENSPQMWRMRRGFWCPEGTVSRVLSEPIIKNCMAMEKATWDGEKTMYAALDPAGNGGDRIVLRFGLNGKDIHGREVLELGDVVIIKTDSTKFNQRPHEYQIADRVKEECEARGVPPYRFAMDVTGLGAGLAGTISEEWGTGLLKVHFASKPSDAPVSPTDFRPCNEVYGDRVTELWYSIRQAVMSYQLKGLDAETAVELCGRRYTDESKIWVESKSDMQSRPGAKSPDCFIAGTMVRTIFGKSEIQNLKVGDLVATPFGYSPVIKIHSSDAVELSTIIVKNTHLTGKPAHRIYCQGRWERLDAITVAMDVEMWDNRWKWKILNSLFARAENTGFKQLVDTIKTVEGVKIPRRDFFIVSFGSSIMGRFLTALKSTTETVIGQIIGSKIWNLFPSPTICEITCWNQCSFPSSGRVHLKDWHSPERLQKNGMHPTMGWNGTNPMGIELGKALKSELENAFGAESNSISNQSNKKSSVRNGATNHSFALLSKLEKLAPFVGKFGCLINTPRRKCAVKAVKTEPCGMPVKVFNITLLEENAYYANGILVENCADALAVLLDLVKEKGKLGTISKARRSMDSSWENLIAEFQAAEEEAYSDSPIAV